jgi:hypothetical protein
MGASAANENVAQNIPIRFVTAHGSDNLTAIVFGVRNTAASAARYAFIANVNPVASDFAGGIRVHMFDYFVAGLPATDRLISTLSNQFGAGVNGIGLYEYRISQANGRVTSVQRMAPNPGPATITFANQQIIRYGIDQSVFVEYGVTQFHLFNRAPAGNSGTVVPNVEHLIITDAVPNTEFRLIGIQPAVRAGDPAVAIYYERIVGNASNNTDLTLSARDALSGLGITVGSTITSFVIGDNAPGALPLRLDGSGPIGYTVHPNATVAFDTGSNTWTATQVDLLDATHRIRVTAEDGTQRIYAMNAAGVPTAIVAATAFSLTADTPITQAITLNDWNEAATSDDTDSGTLTLLDATFSMDGLAADVTLQSLTASAGLTVSNINAAAGTATINGEIEAGAPPAVITARLVHVSGAFKDVVITLTRT